jgi:hypothetical protein
MDGTSECIEQAVTDSRKAVIIHTGVLGEGLRNPCKKGTSKRVSDLDGYFANDIGNGKCIPDFKH